MGKPQLKILPISQNGQISCLFHEISKSVAYFMKLAILGLCVTYIFKGEMHDVRSVFVLHGKSII